MNRADWFEVVSDLNGSFSNGFPPDRAEAFWRRFGQHMSRREFDAVMDRIVERQGYSPNVAEFVAERDRQHGLAVLPWTAVWPIVEVAAHAVDHGNANQRMLDWAAENGVDTAGMEPRVVADGIHGNTPGIALAAAVVRVRAGHAAAAWFEACGRKAITAPSATFGDATYGTSAIRKLGESYAEFVAALPPQHAALTAAPATPQLDR